MTLPTTWQYVESFGEDSEIKDASQFLGEIESQRLNIIFFSDIVMRITVLSFHHICVTKAADDIQVDKESNFSGFVRKKLAEVSSKGTDSLAALPDERNFNVNKKHSSTFL